MEKKDTSKSGSLDINDGGGRGIAPTPVLQMQPLPQSEPRLRPQCSSMTVGSGSSDFAKKKRGRPRKYDSDGNLRVVSPTPSLVDLPTSLGFSMSHLSKYSSSKSRGRPPCSGEFMDTARADFTPHVINVDTGEDVASKILSLFQKGPREIFVLSANGTVSNLTICQPGSSGGALTYEGEFEILSLSGSFTISESGDVKSRYGGLSVSVAGPDGQVIGGGIAGTLVAANPIQSVIGSFIPNEYKMHKTKQQYEARMVSVQGSSDVPSQIPIENHGANTKQTAAIGRKLLPDINLPAPEEEE